MRYEIILYIIMKKAYIISFCCLFSINCFAQAWVDAEKSTPAQPFKDIEYTIEMQGSFSKNATPLWHNANKYGLSSLETTNGYLRTSLIRPVENDSTRRWGFGYGIDVALPVNYSSKLIVQQAFAELRWLHGALTIGSKERTMELKNNRLSSGAQTLGINARPVPQVRLSLPEYWRLPIANGWLHLKGHIALGRFTDDQWMKTFTKQQSKYTEKVLYNSKAGFLKIGNEDVFAPLSIEMGLEMATQFGGTSYRTDPLGNPIINKGGTSFKDIIHAFIPGGHEVTESDIVYKNVTGNHLGSWLARINYETDTWKASIYADKFFEDHSAMLQIDYNGYGTGAEWNQRTKSRWFVYDFKDFLLGAELQMKYGTWIRNIVFEYVYSKYQSGPIYHDRTPNIPDHTAGRDDFYNHLVYSSWQHWGQVMGNPLYLSPQYNKSGETEVKDNRFVAYHIGLEGSPYDNLNYRVLATYRRGYGSYNHPYVHPKESFHCMLEASYQLKKRWLITGSYAMDFGKYIGNNTGVQLTISKKGILGL